MSLLKKKLLLFSGLCSLILFSWLLPRIFSQQFCINSSVVDKIVIYKTLKSSFEQHEIESCSLKTLMLGERTSQESKELLKFAKRIEKLNSLETILKNQPKLPTLFIAQSEPFVYLVKEDFLLLGQEIATSKGQLERAVLQFVLGYEKTDNQRAFTKEVLADVYLAYATKKFEMEDPFTKDTYNPSKLSLHTSYRTWKDYCHWALKSFRHIIYCTELNSLDSSSHPRLMDEPSVWSLRPLISGILWRSIELSGFWGIQSLKQHNFQDIQSRLDEIEDVFNLGIPHSFATKRWVEFMAGGLAKILSHGVTYDPTALVKALDEKYITRVPQFEYKIQLLEASQLGYQYTLPNSNGLDHIIEFQNGVQLLPDFNYLMPHFYFDFEYKKELIVGCHLPPPKKLLELDAKHDEIYFIRLCSPSNNVSYTKISEQGIEKYLASNTSVEYVKIHRPTLDSMFSKAIANKKQKFNALPAYNIVSWQDIIDFEKAQWDDEIGAFRSDTESGAVDAFRLESIFQ